MRIFVADLLITAPISMVAGYGVWNLRRWGLFFGWLAAGIYIYGSAVVYIMIIQQGQPYQLELIIPPIFGIVISIGLMFWSWKNQDAFN